MTLALATPQYGRAVATGPGARPDDPALTEADRLADAADRALERSFAARDAGSLEAAYRRHGRTVYTFAVRSAGPDLAEEVTQDVFVAAWSSAARYDPDRGSLAGWLLGIARHKVADALRQRQRAAARLDRAAASGATAPPGGGDGGVELDRLAERLLVAEGLDTLPADAREAVELAFRSDLTHQQIAEVTGRPLGTVKAQIRRSLAKLRRHLEGIDAAP